MQCLQLQIAGNKCKSQEFTLQALKSHQNLQALLKNKVQNTTKTPQATLQEPIAFYLTEQWIQELQFFFFPEPLWKFKWHPVDT